MFVNIIMYIMICKLPISKCKKKILPVLQQHKEWKNVNGFKKVNADTNDGRQALK